MFEFTIRPIVEADRQWLAAFMRERWGSEAVAVHDQLFVPSTLDGFVAEREGRPVGVLTYVVSHGVLEIVTLDSTLEQRGVGSALVEAAASSARRRAASRLRLVTTNDNVHALEFYQKRGFRIVRFDRNAVVRARILKPGIPLVAENGVPILDELELERVL